MNIENLVNVEGGNFKKAIRLTRREALLQKAAFFWTNFQILHTDDKRSLLNAFLSELELQQGLAFLAGNKTWEPVDALHDNAIKILVNQIRVYKS